MSIFGKKKQESPPAPPMPSSGGLNDIKSEINNSNSNTGSMSPPPMPPPQTSNGLNSTTPPMPPSAVGMDSPLPPPSPPLSNDKSPTSSSSSQMSMETSKMTSDSNEMNQSSQSSSNKVKTMLDESLFSLEDFELPNLDDLDSVDSKINSNKLDNAGNPNSILQNNSQNQTNLNDSFHSKEISTHNLNSEHFIPTKGLTSSKEETFFLTTNEFKNLLELIDAVKERVRVSTQRHMKITTIKAEEDIEYENMKKDFQFIEDKLYEVDSTIFER